MMETGPVRLLCRILHCQPAPNGAFTVGARFIRELAETTAVENPVAGDETPLRRAS